MTTKRSMHWENITEGHQYQFQLNMGSNFKLQNQNGPPESTHVYNKSICLDVEWVYQKALKGI
jgi:hypothetical protein